MGHSLVITSINPHGRIDYQLCCFQQWRRVGYDIVTLNGAREREMLLRAGLQAEDIIELPARDTAVELIGKDIPRILPSLERALSLDADFVFLANSDIYPAQREPLSNHLSLFSDCAAFTRNDCLRVPGHRYTDSNPYRGGLDVFFFTREKLSDTLDSLRAVPVAQRMTFGIPGWDFFLGHELASKQGGTFADGLTLLHQFHKASYSSIREFDAFAAEMIASGRYESDNPTSLATEFKSLIDRKCGESAAHAERLNRFYYRSPNMPGKTVYPRRLKAVESEYARLLSDYGISSPIDHGLIEDFLLAQAAGVDWSAAEAFVDSYHSRAPRFTAMLAVILLLLLFKRSVGRITTRCTYPRKNLHADTLRELRKSASGNQLTESVVGLFGEELTEHSVFNKNMFKHIVLKADNRDKLQLCEAIFHMAFLEFGYTS